MVHLTGFEPATPGFKHLLFITIYISLNLLKIIALRVYKYLSKFKIVYTSLLFWE